MSMRVLLHYDSATLKELYFLRPQWLCDVLVHVVTVREINPFASNGGFVIIIMHTIFFLTFIIVLIIIIVTVREINPFASNGGFVRDIGILIFITRGRQMLERFPARYMPGIC
ncbi:hypothetical protein JYU34_018025 [Plutella xylostella]|uniref:Uncharacterized protein n=1 Tax=Plutella xylostella TaxID=51655 RepID=A0ABQ7Q3C1_PLUXY|nr:hypothetical protein JYU34_018025 [Plutella xylostella]